MTFFLKDDQMFEFSLFRHLVWGSGCWQFSPLSCQSVFQEINHPPSLKERNTRTCACTCHGQVHRNWFNSSCNTIDRWHFSGKTGGVQLDRRCYTFCRLAILLISVIDAVGRGPKSSNSKSRRPVQKSPYMRPQLGLLLTCFTELSREGRAGRRQD